MDNGEWDHMSIVNSCKASTFTNPTIIFETSPSPQIPITITTNNIITPQNTKPSYFNDFTVIQENNSSPFTPQKSTDFIPTTIIPNPTSTSTFYPISTTPTTMISNPTIITTPTSTSSPISTTTTLTSLTTTIPTYITTAPFDRAYNHQLVPQQPLREHNQLPILLPQTPITTTTNTIIPAQNTTPSYFKDFTVIQENNSTPFISLKPTDFIDLEKLRVSFNHNNTLPIPTTIIPNLTTIMTPAPSISTILTSTTTTSSPIATTITPTSLTTTIPAYITTAHANHVYDRSSIPKQPLRQSNQLQFLLPPNPNYHNHDNIISPQNTTSSYFDSFTFIQENNHVPLAPHKPTEFVDLNKLRINFNHNTTLPIPTTNITNLITIKTPTTSIPTIISTTSTTTSYSISTATIPASSTTTILTQNRTSHFDLGYNHLSVPQQTPRQYNQLPRTSSRVLPNTYPQQPKFKSRKRKNYNQMSLVCHVKEGNLSEDSWKWKKYGQKPIKESPHPRNYYKCSTLKDCSARKLVEKSNIKENTYVVTYIGVHNHEKWLVNQNSRK